MAYRQTPDSVAYAVIADTLNRIDPRRRFLSADLLAFWKFGLDIKALEGSERLGRLASPQLADLRLAGEASVPILVGSDLGASLVYPGFSVHEELQYLVEQGGSRLSRPFVAGPFIRRRHSGLPIPWVRSKLEWKATSCSSARIRFATSETRNRSKPWSSIDITSSNGAGQLLIEAEAAALR